MGEKCVRNELRTLFLFESLTDDQLDTLCANGHIATFEPGPVCTEGEPATCFYVMLEGELVMSQKSGGIDIETNRTSMRGVYCGAWSAYIPDEQPVYEASVRVTKKSRFFVLDADAYADFMRAEFPMAVHLLEGHKVGGMNRRRILGQRDKLLALGQLSAGLTHQLNNPAAATARAVADLHDRIAKMRLKLLNLLGEGQISQEALQVLVSAQRAVADQVAKARTIELSAIETSDREDQLGDWLERHDIENAWDYASTFVEAGQGIDWLESIASAIGDSDGTATLEGALGWLKYTIDTELLMCEIAEASKRISTLLADAKQYSQMDRAPYQNSNLHELLRSTFMMFGDRLHKDTGVKLVKEYDHAIPELECYPADLNQVWTNLIENALQAMDGKGVLTVRTTRVDEDTVRVEINDNGPGIPADVIERIFTPFFTTKPFGEGTGLGLDLAWRIVCEKHHGNLYVESEPGNTTFIVTLPVHAPPPDEVAIGSGG